MSPTLGSAVTRSLAALGLSVLLLATPAGAAEDAAPTAGPSRIVDSFFAKLKSGPASDAYALLFRGTPMLERKPAEVAYLATQTDSALKTYGAFDGFEFVREDSLSPSVLRQAYVLKTEAMPTIWWFYFYKRGPDWTVTHIFFSDKITEAYGSPGGGS
jgi:hypothetical protein